jgi:hypothetical protein
MLAVILERHYKSIQKMIETVIYKLLDTTSFNLRLNEDLSKFTLISELLTHNSIPFQTWNPEGNLSLEIVEMSFSINCKFQDIYLLAYLLKDFGLESVYPSRKQEVEISVGTYLHQVPNMGKYAMAEPMNIDSFLSIDPKSDTQIVVDSYFENKFSDEENGEDYEQDGEEDYEQDYDDRDDHDYERDTFDALTDGQYGDYDDWREGGGDMDSLRDGLGY